MASRHPLCSTQRCWWRRRRQERKLLSSACRRKRLQLHAFQAPSQRNPHDVGARRNRLLLGGRRHRHGRTFHRQGLYRAPAPWIPSNQVPCVVRQEGHLSGLAPGAFAFSSPMCVRIIMWFSLTEGKDHLQYCNCLTSEPQSISLFDFGIPI